MHALGKSWIARAGVGPAGSPLMAPGSFPAASFFGPSPLVQTDLLAMNMEGAEPPAAGSGKDDKGLVSAAGWAACGVPDPAKPLRPVHDATSLASAANGVFDSCLNDFSADVGGGTAYGSNYKATGGTKKFTDWQEQYYNCAIALTDQARTEEATVHVIGLAMF